MRELKGIGFTLIGEDMLVRERTVHREKELLYTKATKLTRGRKCRITSSRYTATWGRVDAKVQVSPKLVGRQSKA